MVPGMVLLMGMAQHRAHATSLAAIIASSAAAVTTLAIDDRVDWDTAGLILLGSLVGAYLGARLSDRVSEIWLARAFVVLILVAAVRMALQGDGAEAADAPAGGFDAGPLDIAGFVALGLIAGALASLLGIGGGLVIVPVLVTLFAFQQHLAQGTSLAVIVPTAAVGTITHARAGRVAVRVALLLGAGGVLGGFLGGRAALSLDAPLLRRLFAVLLVITAVQMLRKRRETAGA
jgi:uncharacterized membrane protein YfcA